MTNAQYELSSNEAVLLKSEQRVDCDGEYGELLLTNVNLMFVTCQTKGFFKTTTTYTTRKYPLRQIKVHNGSVQILLGKDGNIEIFFISGLVNFHFSNSDTLFSKQKAEREAAKWVGAIRQAINGEHMDAGTPSSTMAPEFEIIADTLGDAVSALKSALGFGSKKSTAESAERIEKKCAFCTAPIAGKRGSIVRCSYCDSDQKL